MSNISNFNNINDYLPILNGCIIAELIIIFLVFQNVFKYYYLRKWYTKYQLNAVIADIFILVIVIILSRYFYKYVFDSFNIWKFIGLTIYIQIIHDILFYLLFKSLPLNYNKMLDFFKEYANEVGTTAVISDSFMISIACLVSYYLASYNLNTNIIILVISVYLLPYMINFDN